MEDQKAKICAVIVTYNPGSVLEQNIKSLKAQADCVIVIDNNSQGEALRLVSALCEEHGAELVRNPENIGIAAALNQGLARAKQKGCGYFLSMDQDSVLGDSCVEIMLGEAERQGIDSIGPSYNEQSQDKEPEEINFLISSGNLTKTEAALKAGGFDEWMFIDGVDIDFSLKLRAAGYKIAKSKKATMTHSIGEKETGRFLFFKRTITVHSLKRHYYAARNNYYLRNKHKKAFPGYCFKLMIAALQKKIRILFFFKNKRAILSSINQGVKDAKAYIKSTRKKAV